MHLQSGSLPTDDCYYKNILISSTETPVITVRRLRHHSSVGKPVLSSYIKPQSDAHTSSPPSPSNPANMTQAQYTQAQAGPQSSNMSSSQYSSIASWTQTVPPRTASNGQGQGAPQDPAVQAYMQLKLAMMSRKSGN